MTFLPISFVMDRTPNHASYPVSKRSSGAHDPFLKIMLTTGFRQSRGIEGCDYPGLVYGDAGFGTSSGEPPMISSPNPHASIWNPIDRSFHDIAMYQDINYLRPLAGAYDPMPREILEPTGRTGESESEPNPMCRFWAGEGPWTPQRVDGVGQGPSAPRYTTPREPIVRPGGHFGGIRDPVQSDPGSYLTDRNTDSGYATKSHLTSSVISGEYPDRSHETHSLAGEINGMQLHQHERLQQPHTFQSPPNVQPMATVDLDKHAGSFNGQAEASLACPDPACTAPPFKNKSELKQVSLPKVCVKRTNYTLGSTLNDIINHFVVKSSLAHAPKVSRQETT